MTNAAPLRRGDRPRFSRKPKVMLVPAAAHACQHKGLSQPGGRASPRAANRSVSSSQDAQSGLYWAPRITDREDAIPPGGGSGGPAAAGL
jgi:hypothetical protein